MLVAVVATVGMLALNPFAAPSASAADSTPPSAPASVKAEYFGHIGTVLSWAKSSAKDIGGFRVYRSSTSKPTTSDKLVADTKGRSVTDTGAVAGAKNYYIVVAYDTSGNVSKASSVKSVTAKDTTKPSTPRSLKLTVSDAGISLDWADNSEIDLAGYRVDRAIGSGSYTTIADGLTASRFLDADAPVAVKSSYRVYAVDRSGNTSGYAGKSATRAGAPAGQLPAAVTGLTTRVNEGAITVSWTASPMAAGYTISRSGDGSTWTELRAGSTSTSYTDTGLTPGTWHYRVVATNESGSSAPATASATIPPDQKAPATPSGVKMTVLPTGGIQLSWNANKESDLAGYVVYKRTPKGTSPRTYQQYLPAEGSAAYPQTSFTDLEATEGSTNYYRIRAIDTSGNLSNYTAFTADNKNVAPAAPSGLKVSAAAEHGLDIAFTAPKDLDVAGYALYRSTASSGTYALIDRVTTDRAGTPPVLHDTSAPKGVAVFYKLAAIDDVGNVSKLSNSVTGTSKTDPIPLAIDYHVITVGAQGDFQTINAALASVPDFSVQPYEIDIAPGTYPEVVRIKTDWVKLHGTGATADQVRITASNAAGSQDPADPGATLGTAGSATMRVDSNDVTLDNLTVANDFDEAANPQITSQQAVALRVEGDRFVGSSIRLIGNQDTLLADTPRTTARERQYFVNSYIEGDVDYLFGAATAVFDRSTFRSLDRGRSNNGYLTAASTNIHNTKGFLITDSKLVSTAADGTINLGRPWHPSADPDAVASVVIRDTWLPSALNTAQPWGDMSSTNSSGETVDFPWQSARFFEYENAGPGAGTGTNRPMLTSAKAAGATASDYLLGKDGWSPVLPATTPQPQIPTDLQGSTDLNSASLTWADTESVDTTHWAVYRAGEDGVFAQIGVADKPEYTDNTAVTGQTYSYRLVALSRTGEASEPSAALTMKVTEAHLDVDISVDPSQAGNGSTVFNTLTDALAAAPAGTLTNPTVISLAPGSYREYPTITKPYTVLIGATGNPADVVITGDRAAGTPTGAVVDGVPQTYGTSGSASLAITASNVQLRDLTVANDYVEGTVANGQAVALRTSGDRLMFRHIRLIGNQDTLYANSSSTTAVARSYYTDSYIQGDVDFLFGRGSVVIDNSTLYVTDHGTSPNGAVTAASTDISNKYGILINNSRILGSAPDGSQNLGRPWQPGVTAADGSTGADPNAIAQVVVRDTWLGPVINPTVAWTDMVNSGVTTPWTKGRFFEYHNSGPGVGSGDLRPQLSDADAATYTPAGYLAGNDGWNPLVPAATDTAPLAPDTPTASPADSQVSLSWNIGSEADVVGWRVYRAIGADPAINDADLVATVNKPEMTDRGLTDGQEYRYAVVAVDRAGQASAASPVASATPAEQPLTPSLTVAQDGSGDYASLQAALAAAPAGTAAKPTVILVKPGTYHEVVSSNKAYLTIVGSTGTASDVIVTFDNANGTATGPSTCPSATGATCGTGGSATVTLSGTGVTVRNLTIQNAFDATAHPEIGNNNTQAVALRALGDKQVYRNVRLLGTQDTLNADAVGNISADGSGYPRQYFADSVIQGNVDYVFGRASAVFQRVSFISTTRQNGTIFAPSHASKNTHGYLVLDSRFASNNDPGSFYLARPWQGWSDGTQPDNSRGALTIVDSWMDEGINAAHPYTDFAPNVWSDGRFAEYGNTGPGVVASPDRPQLSATDAAHQSVAAYLNGGDGWDPSVTAPAAGPLPVVTGLKAVGGDQQVSLTWAPSEDVRVVGYRVSEGGTGLATVTRPQVQLSGLVNGVAHDYSVVAIDSNGQTSAPAHVSATPAQRVDAVVGGGGFASLTDALAAAPASGSYVIQVADGSYAGPTTVSRSDVTIIGDSGAVLTNDTATPTLTITGSDVLVRGVTVRNATSAGNAPAVYLTGDRVQLDQTQLIGTGRTVWADVPTAGATSRQAITRSTIVGQSSIVLGRATLVISRSEIQVGATSGLVLVPSTTAVNGSGFLVIDSTIVPQAGVSDVRLGGGYAQGVTDATNAPQAWIARTDLAAGIKANPWMDFNGFAWTSSRFAEYQNTGAGAATGPSDTRPQLTDAQGSGLGVAGWVGDWVR